MLELNQFEQLLENKNYAEAASLIENEMKGLRLMLDEYQNVDFRNRLSWDSFFVSQLNIETIEDKQLIFILGQFSSLVNDCSGRMFSLFIDAYAEQLFHDIYKDYRFQTLMPYFNKKGYFQFQDLKKQLEQDDIVYDEAILKKDLQWLSECGCIHSYSSDAESPTYFSITENALHFTKRIFID